jgi:DNA-binding response OmpR family regulator
VGSKVLIVDDDPVVNAIYAKQFRDARFDVRIALDPLDGFIVLHSFRPDVIVLDLKMPFRSGLDWLVGVRKNVLFRDVPVVVVTGEAPDSPLVQNAVGAKVCAVLFKSEWDPGAIVATTTSVLSAPRPLATH